MFMCLPLRHASTLTSTLFEVVTGCIWLKLNRHAFACIVSREATGGTVEVEDP